MAARPGVTITFARPWRMPFNKEPRVVAVTVLLPESSLIAFLRQSLVLLCGLLVEGFDLVRIGGGNRGFEGRGLSLCHYGKETRTYRELSERVVYDKETT